MMGSYEKIAKGLGWTVPLSAIPETEFLHLCAGRPGRPVQNGIADQFIKKLTSEAAKNEGNLVIEASSSSIKRKSTRGEVSRRKFHHAPNQETDRSKGILTQVDLSRNMIIPSRVPFSKGGWGFDI